MNTERKELIKRVEKLLGWGEVANWSNYDFEKLSDVIHSKTEVTLSVTTLKRVLGKIQYTHSPSTTTLNTLAQFVDYEDWRAFQRTHQLTTLEYPATKNEDTKGSTIKHFSPRGIFLIVLLTVCFMGIFVIQQKDDYHPDDFRFSTDKIFGEGVPNSVVFTYDATKARTDSVFIVQTWDITRKTLVPKNGHKHSAIYYYPGFFRTKLVVDNQIVRSQDLQISSNGWLTMIEMEKAPVYFDEADVLNGAGVKVNEATIEEYGFELLPDAPKVRMFYQGDLGRIKNDNFIFETEIKNPFNKGTNSCQFVEVLIQCKNDIILIPLCAKNCVGQVDLYAAGIEKNSKNADLSKFGVDLTHWTNLRVTAKNRFISFYVNGEKAEAFEFPNIPTGIVGVQYRFNGPSAVKYAQFRTDDKVISLE